MKPFKRRATFVVTVIVALLAIIPVTAVSAAAASAAHSGHLVAGPDIRKVQGQRLEVGKPGGKNPLHRGASTTEKRNNRAEVCPKTKRHPQASRVTSTPFASTSEGGKALPEIDRITGWVPKKENDDQGTIIGSLYRPNRIFRAD